MSRAKQNKQSIGIGMIILGKEMKFIKSSSNPRLEVDILKPEKEWIKIRSAWDIYPLVNVYITMENHHV
jgi:hypothetical protein